MSYAIAWRGDCTAAYLKSNRIGSIYLLGHFSFRMARRHQVSGLNNEVRHLVACEGWLE